MLDNASRNIYLQVQYHASPISHKSDITQVRYYTGILKLLHKYIFSINVKYYTSQLTAECLTILPDIYICVSPISRKSDITLVRYYTRTLKPLHIYIYIYIYIYTNVL